MDVVSTFANKDVRFRFAGADLRFRLSLGLFSSYDIDAGTKLLLKTIAQKVPLDAIRTALDVGCGVGTVGVCIGKRNPNCSVVMQDRDALAVAFSQANAVENGLSGHHVHGSLALWELGQRRFDLVASNVPAKAGPPVLRWFFRHAAAPLSPEGVVATVVVEPLAELTRESILSARGEILHSEGTKNHHVYHYRAPTPTIEERLDPYLRGQKEFTIPGHRYRLRTVYGLPEFDTLGFGTVLAAQMLRSYSVGGTIGIWNPGQGHLCRIAALTGGPTSFLLSSRDRLELEIAMANVQSGDEAVEVRTEHEASPALLADRVEPASLDALLYVVRPVSGVPWYTQAVPLATAALRPGARWFVVGRSTDLAGTAKQPHPFALEASKKLRGYRVLVLRR